MTDTAKTVDVSKMSPSGIMPTRADTIESIASLNVASPKKYERENSRMPTGNRMIETCLMIAFSDFMISEFNSCFSFATFAIFEE